MEMDCRNLSDCSFALEHLESTQAGLPSDDAHILKVLFAFVNENCSCRIKGLGHTARRLLTPQKSAHCVFKETFDCVSQSRGSISMCFVVFDCVW